jgi:hypothetical protein
VDGLEAVAHPLNPTPTPGIAGATTAAMVGPDGGKSILIGGTGSDGDPHLWLSGPIDPTPGDYVVSSFNAQNGPPALLGGSLPTSPLHVASSGTAGSTGWKVVSGQPSGQLSTFGDPSVVTGRLWLANDDGLVIVLIEPAYSVTWGFLAFTAAAAASTAFAFDEPVKAIAAGRLDANTSVDLAVLTQDDSGGLAVSVARGFLATTGAPVFDVDLPITVLSDLDRATARVAVMDIVAEDAGSADEILVFDAAGNMACIDPNSAATDCGHARTPLPQ